MFQEEFHAFSPCFLRRKNNLKRSFKKIINTNHRVLYELLTVTNYDDHHFNFRRPSQIWMITKLLFRPLNNYHEQINMTILNMPLGLKP